MSEPTYSFGAWVRRRRKALDLTQDALARLVGVAAITIQKIEADERRPSRQVAELLADQLQIPHPEREAFLAAARGEQPADQLAAPQANLPATPARAPGHLPTRLSSFIGRAHELRELTDLLAQPTIRLMTLTGAGGSGKTRLAIQVAAAVAERYPDGVWFIDLSPISDPLQVASAAAQALGIPQRPDVSPRDQLCTRLREQQALLLLDNCEQVVEAAATLAADLLHATPHVTFLATSRAPLRLAGEQEYPVGSLGLPTEVPRTNHEPNTPGARVASHTPAAGGADATRTIEAADRPDHPLTQAPRHHPTPPDLAHYPAVQLFVARARAIQPAFQLTDANAPAVATICVRLDGLPLAIELAAARVRTLSPAQLLARLATAQLLTLAGGARDLPARQQTIRATIAWSYNLLGAAEQALFRRLGMFVDGWALDAAEALCADPGQAVLDGMEALVAHSLVRVDASADAPRYTMLETIREYALERLAEQGELEPTRERYAGYFVQLAEQAEPKLRSGEQLVWLARLDAEQANLEAALTWALDDPAADPERQTIGLRLAANLWYWWRIRSHTAALPHWLNHPAVAHPHIPVALRARALVRGGYALNNSDNILSQTMLPAGLHAATEADDEPLIILALLGMNSVHAPAQSLERAETTLARATRLGDRWLLSDAQSLASQVYGVLGHQDSIPLAHAAIAHARTTGDRRLLIECLTSLARNCIETGDHAMAHTALEEALGLCHVLHSQQGIANVLLFLAAWARGVGHQLEARRLTLQRLELERSIGNSQGVWSAYWALADLARDHADYPAARRTFHEGRAIAQQLGNQLLLALLSVYEGLIAMEQGRHDEAEALMLPGITYMQEHEFHGHESWGLTQLGLVRYARGDLAGALACCDTGEQARRHAPNVSMHVQHWAIYGLVVGRSVDPTRGLAMLDACIASGRSLHIAFWFAVALHNRAILHFSQRQLNLGMSDLRDAFVIMKKIGMRRHIAQAIEMIGLTLCERNQGAFAARLWGAAEVLREQLGAPIWPIDRPDYEQRVAEARAQIIPEEWNAAWAAGRTLTWEQAADEALAWLETQEMAP